MSRVAVSEAGQLSATALRTGRTPSSGLYRSSAVAQAALYRHSSLQRSQPPLRRSFHATPLRPAKNDSSTIDYFHLPPVSVSHPLSPAPPESTNHSASYLTAWYPPPYVYSGSTPSTGTEALIEEAYDNIGYLSDLSRYPLAPDSFEISHAAAVEAAEEQIDEQESAGAARPKISVVASDPDVVNPGAPLAEIEGMGAGGINLSFVRDLHNESGGSKEAEGGLVSDLWKGFLDDVFGPKQQNEKV